MFVECFDIKWRFHLAHFESLHLSHADHLIFESFSAEFGPSEKLGILANRRSVGGRQKNRALSGMMMKSSTDIELFTRTETSSQSPNMIKVNIFVLQHENVSNNR